MWAGVSPVMLQRQSGVHLWNPSLEQECSEPYLPCTDLREKGALVLPKALVLLECLPPFELGVYIRWLYTY